MIKHITISIFMPLLLIGCGGKIVKMNEYKDINYSYHPHTNSDLEKTTYEMILDDSSIARKKEKLSGKLDENLNDELNDIIANKGNSNIMITDNRLQNKPQRNGGIFKDRFENLRLNR